MDDIRECYAYHEAGHIILGWLYDQFVDSNLNQTDEQCGQTNNRSTFENMSREACVSILIAGPIAERIFRQEAGQVELDCGAIESDDYYLAVQKVGYNPIFDDIAKLQLLREEIEEEFGERIATVLKDNWAAVKEIKNILLAEGHIDHNETDSVLRKSQNKNSDRSIQGDE